MRLAVFCRQECGGNLKTIRKIVTVPYTYMQRLVYAKLQLHSKWKRSQLFQHNDFCQSSSLAQTSSVVR